ncbi:hypothetical protein SAMN05421748_103285 [Paractinoplanes atraurantiacus]|uniref:Uncharacterized protein n=2 Tax=Paractinoplanes atraurantiacus TaxID=1036182 RepID=A0A285H199_9ACTN|nr:hypothetical protein SAMN05421748_103285 [Actinoplanes atraurantiacus]
MQRSAGLAQWNGAGHLLMFSRELQHFYDPTLDQVAARTGIGRGALIMRAVADDFDHDLPIELDSGLLLYRPVLSDQSWRSGYNGEYVKCGPLAREMMQRALELEGLDENLI